MDKHICMICDENYVMPTCVTIQSLSDSNPEEKFIIHIIASAITMQMEEQLKRMATENIAIQLMAVNAEEIFMEYHEKKAGSICVATEASLFKFLIPDFLPDLDKILYIDGDLIVKGKIRELYETDISDYYAAAVIDSGSIYYKHEYVKKVKSYFNSGVMLFNLKKLREDNMPAKLCKTKRSLHDSLLMDQNVFNIAFDKKVRLLPIKYNFLPVNLYRANEKWKIEDINEKYQTAYKNKRDLYADAMIVHYSSKDKPWKNPDVACADLWIHSYLRTPVDHNLLKSERCGRKTPQISIVVPCYNSGKYIEETLGSVAAQTFKNLETICIDDGSTDDTLEKLHACAIKYPAIHMRIFANTNAGAGSTRNFGIMQAQGKYIYYLDSDDLLHPDCLAILHDCMEENSLDLVFFEGTSFFENGCLKEQFSVYESLYKRKEAYPKVYGGKELYIKFRKDGGFIVQPCLQMVKREILLHNDIKFPEIAMYEDNIYVVKLLLAATRVKCLWEVLFYRRIRAGSLMTTPVDERNFKAYGQVLSEMVSLLLLIEKRGDLCFALCKHIIILFNNWRKTYMSLTPAQKQNILKDINLKKYLYLMKGVQYVSDNKEQFAAFWGLNDLGQQLKMRSANFKQVEAINLNDRHQLQEPSASYEKEKSASPDYGRQLKELSDRCTKIEEKMALVCEALSLKERELQNIKTGYSFRIGRIITFFPRKSRSGIRCYKEHGFRYTVKRILWHLGMK